MAVAIDLRSDTCTLQPDGMKEAMYKAEVGDEYYDDDPTVIELQNLAAKMLGKEAGLFVASGTMGNLVSCLAQSKRGDIVLLEADSHLFRCERGNFAVVGGLVPKQIQGKNGILKPEDIEAAIPPDGLVNPEAGLILIENPHNAAGGTCITPEQMSEYRKVADKYNLNIHVDGARIFNAAVALDVPPEDLVKDADTLSFCLSKSLAGPFGAVVVGSEEIIQKARKFKQMLGGGFRQAGYMAAAGIYALKQMIDRLEEDHQNAKTLAHGLINLGMEIGKETVQTNMVYFKVPPSLIDANLLYEGINSAEKIAIKPPDKNRIRLVTHYGIDENDINYFLEVVKNVLKRK